MYSIVVNFQVIHSFKSVLELEKVIIEILKNINEEIISEESYYYVDKTVRAFSYSINYNIEQFSHKKNMTGIEFSFRSYIEEYLDEVSTLTMGLDWGAGEILNKVSYYIYEFAETLKNKKNIINVIKLFDGNMQSSYMFLAHELYEIEMSVREVLSLMLYKEIETDKNLTNLIKNKINIRNKMNIKDLEEHFENELFTLNFSHYKELLKSNKGNIFISDIQEPLTKIQLFRNCIMHNRGFYGIDHQEYEEAKKKLENIINEFWKKHSIKDLVLSVDNP